ncbi:thioredoxin-like domain-containing protein [Thalassobellus citreus]|uniref:TlpA family protein disulfide reductase n=1 Tax=Thalassobellus citreus TaxID=3367752 RepID=UPI00379DAF25
MKPFYLLFLLLATQAFSQNPNNSKTILPDSVFGEWYHLNNGKDTSVLIHKGFIEYHYSAFMYEEIKKINDTTFSFSAKDVLGKSLNCDLIILAKDSIKLRRGKSELITCKKREHPLNSKQVKFNEIPELIKRNWYTTSGDDSLEFKVTDNEFLFKGEKYIVDEIINFKSNGDEQYRFVVKKDKTYWMLYFKKWSEDYLQVGIHGKYGYLYKSNKAYPNSRIENVKEYMASIVPKEIRGNWLKTDGSNLWSHSFYYNFAVLEQAKWNYKTVKKKGSKYVVTLEKNGTEKVVYAQPNTNNTVSFGTNKKELQPYSLKKINTPNAKLKENKSTMVDPTILKVGIATYSGIIKNFSKDSTEKTGAVAVNNIFTGDQDSYLIEIKEDGSFSVSFPCYHLQQVYVKFSKSYSAVYVAPGKKTWHFINSSKKSEGFFAGDLKQLNTDFASLSFLVFDKDYHNLSKNINKLTPQDYKVACFDIQKQQIQTLDSISETRFLSKKAYKTMHEELTYRAYQNVLSYDMYKRTKRKDSANVDAKYIDFIAPDILNNKNAIQTSSYGSLINRLKYLRHFRKGISVSHPNISELAKILKDQGVELTDDELDLVEKNNSYNKENAQAIKKQKDFYEKHKDISRGIIKKYGTLYQKMTPDERKKYFGRNMKFDDFTVYIKENNLDIVFTDAEKEFQKKSKNILTKEEQERAELFSSEENNKQRKAFTEKHKSYIDKFVSNELKRKGIEKIRENLEDTFTTDIIIAQEILGTLSRNYTPLSNIELQNAKKEIKNSFIADVLTIENDKLKAKIEANKIKTGFVVNTTSNTEADEIFETIISKYKGKVVFVDFWATWCSPCRSGIKRMKPLKEDYKGKDVAFVYITSPSSPETTYNNMIPDIKGEHYRVSKDEWNYLKGKFNISGIPHYLLIDKKGNVVKRNTSDLRSPESVKGLLDSYLEK